ncbi:hypothetical protein GCM10009601_04230 [Streptomyces thermospinosisporus]|uniref:Uncharacterized protein n=1 Tax=Streptomyces thermospinosisporus TaxID=161482 RepID=A0ABP4J8F5_9ACTN
MRTAAFTVHAGGAVDEPEKPSQAEPAEDGAGHTHTEARCCGTCAVCILAAANQPFT